MSQSVTGFMWTNGRFVLKKICGYQISGFVWTRPKVPSKRIRINFAIFNSRHILFARIYLRIPFTRRHWIRPPKPHVFETTLHGVFFWGDSKELRTRVDYHDWNRVCFILFTQVCTFSPPGFVFPEGSNQLFKIDNSFQFDWLYRVMLTAKKSEDLFPDTVSLL